MAKIKGSYGCWNIRVVVATRPDDASTFVFTDINNPVLLVPSITLSH